MEAVLPWSAPLTRCQAGPLNVHVTVTDPPSNGVKSKRASVGSLYGRAPVAVSTTVWLPSGVFFSSEYGFRMVGSVTPVTGWPSITHAKSNRSVYGGETLALKLISANGPSSASVG